MTPEIQKLREEVTVLQNRIKSLEEIERSKTISFVEKLRLWNETENGKHLDHVPFQEDYPLLHAYLKGSEFDRHRRYDLREYFQDEVYLLSAYDEEDRNPELVSERIKGILEEIVEKNLTSFEYDW